MVALIIIIVGNATGIHEEHESTRVWITVTSYYNPGRFKEFVLKSRSPACFFSR